MQNSIIPFYKQQNNYFEKANKSYIYDLKGNKYIDFESGDWAAILGYSNKNLNTVIKKQVDLLIHDGLRFRNKLAEELSNQLLEKLLLKGGKSVFLNSGSEAVNLAILIARNITKRRRVLKLDCSYLSAFGFGQISEMNPDLLSIRMNDFNGISTLSFDEIAAFVFEPGNAWGLIKFSDNNFIKLIAKLVKDSGGLLIANEVTTGFGRTGKWFGYQYYDYIPDIVATGKALGNGYPVSGVSISKEVSGLFEKQPFRYAQSHQNDPLGCAVGIEVIKIIEKDSLIEKSFKTGQYFIQKLEELKTKQPVKIKEIRGRGLMIGLEFDAAINVENIYMQLIEKGFLIGFKENVIRFMPPLIIELADIDKLIATLEAVLA